MPIYSYRCSSCGHASDILQKMSDAQLTICPACNGETFNKQLTAPGFQLKGSGWYATDFKGGAKPPTDTPAESKAATETKAPVESKVEATPSKGGSESCASN